MFAVVVVVFLFYFSFFLLFCSKNLFHPWICTIVLASLPFMPMPKPIHSLNPQIYFYIFLFSTTIPTHIGYPHTRSTTCISGWHISACWLAFRALHHLSLSHSLFIHWIKFECLNMLKNHFKSNTSIFGLCKWNISIFLYMRTYKWISLHL